MTIRFFGSPDCETCQALKADLDARGEEYAFVDASRFDDEAINQLCDDNNVSDFPHIQLLDDQNKVLGEVKGDILPCHVVTLIEQFRNG